MLPREKYLEKSGMPTHRPPYHKYYTTTKTKKTRNCSGGEGYIWFTRRTDPQPPNRSLAHPKKTFLTPSCRRAPAHIMHGSTVTYRSVDLKISALYVLRISSTAQSSACRIPYTSVGRGNMDIQIAFCWFHSCLCQ